MRALVFVLTVAAATLNTATARAGVDIKLAGTEPRWTVGQTVEIEFTDDGPSSIVSARVRVFRFLDESKLYRDEELRVGELGKSPYKFKLKVPATEAKPGASETVIVEVRVRRGDTSQSSDQLKAIVTTPRP